MFESLSLETKNYSFGYIANNSLQRISGGVDVSWNLNNQQICFLFQADSLNQSTLWSRYVVVTGDAGSESRWHTPDHHDGEEAPSVAHILREPAYPHATVCMFLICSAFASEWRQMTTVCYVAYAVGVN